LSREYKFQALLNSHLTKSVNGAIIQEIQKEITMTTKTFSASQFTDYAESRFSTAQDKAKFANQFVKFVRGGYKRTDFPKWFYTRLSMTFGHYAHYNQEGFYSDFFDCFDPAQGKAEFLRQTLSYGCYGDARFTYCDVEKALQQWLKTELY
jgi:hypothetical protein